MLHRVLIASATAMLLLTSLHSDKAFAFRGGARAGGVHHGYARPGCRGGGTRWAGGRYGHRRGYAYRYGRRYPYGVGAAAAGAAAVGAAAAGAYYGSGCGYNAYGNWVCPPY